MAAYGALLSLSNTLHQVLNPPPLHNFILDQQQIQFLLHKVNFFINFLENYPQTQRNEEIERVERRIADAAHTAEDIVESNVVDQIHAARSRIIDSDDRERFITLLCQGIQMVLEKFISIEKEFPMMMLTQGVEGLQLKSCASRSFPGGKKPTMVGLDQQVEKIMSELASDEPSRRVISIVGMGGIGKTTLATAVYKHPYIIEYFDVRAWVTVSQEYTIDELLEEINKSVLDRDRQGSSDDYLGLQLHKKLFGRRYLIVMDDVWDVEALEGLKRFLPPNENGSRVLVTSRLSYMAYDDGFICKLDFLDKEHSWNLLCNTIFGEGNCPVELEEIGKKIAEGCGGLPLALVLIGGLLAKSERIREHWEYFFERHMMSSLNSGNDEQVMKILSLSYNHLPVHLKPCFLYLAIFPEDFEIRVSRLVGLWVVEGLIKPTQDKCLEDVAYEYVEDLINRNVMLVEARGSRGNVKSCKLHDRVRDLCITEAAKQEFVYTSKLDDLIISPYIETARRLSISSTGEPLEITIEALQSATLTRSWFSPDLLFEDGCGESSTDDSEYSTDDAESSTDETESSTDETESPADEMEASSTVEKKMDYTISSSRSGMQEAYPNEKVNKVTEIINGFRLLKVVQVLDKLCIEYLNLCNLRFVFARKISSFLSITLCWNLQILIFVGAAKRHIVPVEIWQMPQLRHMCGAVLTLLDPPDDDQNMVVLENLHTLEYVYRFKCSEQVLRKVPNLRKLKIYSVATEVENHCLQNLACFKKLESLLIIGKRKLPTSIAFPVLLKRLDLECCRVTWAYLSIVVGSLPNLEVLKLYEHATEGYEWNPIEGKFCRLKFLLIYQSKLKIWGAEKEHFPCLERLVLKSVELEEIPMSFAEILTLEMIELDEVKKSLLTSVREISEERMQLGYEPLILLN